MGYGSVSEGIFKCYGDKDLDRCEFLGFSDTSYVATEPSIRPRSPHRNSIDDIFDETSGVKPAPTSTWVLAKRLPSLSQGGWLTTGCSTSINIIQAPKL
jgi:hypothetical protein